MCKINGLSPLELKALSMPCSLRFLMGVEYDVVMCITDVGNRRPFSILFPIFTPVFSELLHMCAARYGLVCKSTDNHTALTGFAKVPALRYIDYLPGALHMEELLRCLGVTPAKTPVRVEGSAYTFRACFIDYKEYQSETSLDAGGNGLYLTLDYGLPTATHSHLVEIQFHKEWDVSASLREFAEFSRWDSFDIRFFDETDKRAGGVVVMPSTQDACDLFERYEDEDSDDDGDLLPFVLRPVAPMIAVPSVEDSVLRKQRDVHWKEIESFWERFPKWRNTVVISNLYDAATLEETLQLFTELPVVAASLVECNSPSKRRRVFVTFATSNAARVALSSDSKSTKGKTLRVQVSPPYLDESRRGRVLSTLNSGNGSDQCIQQAAGVTRSPKTLHGSRSERNPSATAMGIEGTLADRRIACSGQREPDNRRRSTAVMPTVLNEPSSGTVISENRASVHNTPQLNCMSPEMTHTSPSSVSSTMNVNAREFVPSAGFYAAVSPNLNSSPVPVVCISEFMLSPTLYPVPGGTVHTSPVIIATPPPPPPPYTAPPPYGATTVQAIGVLPHVVPASHHSA